MSSLPSVAEPPSSPRYSWLPAAVPEDAETIRTGDPALETILLEAGARRGAVAPDVEFAREGEIGGDASRTVVLVDAGQPEGGSPPARAARRAIATVRVRRRAAAARAALVAAGYDRASVVLWDLEQVLRIPGVSPWRRRATLAERLPQRALVHAGRNGGPTALEAAVRASSEAVGAAPSFVWPLASAGRLVTLTNAGVLRVCIGRTRNVLQEEQRQLETLIATAPPQVCARLPEPLAHGRAGLADWFLERRLSGLPADSLLPEPLVRECVDFLAALYPLGGAAPSRAVADDAAVVASACSPSEGRAAMELARAVDKALAAVPRGFAHGDFWHRNVLVSRGRIAGIIDWDAAGAGRLPLLDLIHLRLTAARWRSRAPLGRAVVETLLPWARDGGDQIASGYCRRIGLEPDPPLLEALAIAYWLRTVARELAVFADRSTRPVWLEANVHSPLRALAPR